MEAFTTYHEALLAAQALADRWQRDTGIEAVPCVGGAVYVVFGCIDDPFDRPMAERVTPFKRGVDKHNKPS